MNPPLRVGWGRGVRELDRKPDKSEVQSAHVPCLLYRLGTIPLRVWIKRHTAKPAENETLKTFEEFFWTAQTLQHRNREGDQRLAPGVPGSCCRDMASL